MADRQTTAELLAALNQPILTIGPSHSVVVPDGVRALCAVVHELVKREQERERRELIHEFVLLVVAGADCLGGRGQPMVRVNALADRLGYPRVQAGQEIRDVLSPAVEELTK